MSREDLSVQDASDASASGSGSSYDEEDHRRLLFGLMRSGLTPQVELALRLIDEASHSSSQASTSYSHPSSAASSSYGEDDDEDSIDSADEYSDGGDEEPVDETEEEGDSPALTTKPLRGTNTISAPVVAATMSNNNERARPRGSGWAWAYSKSDDQQNTGSAGQPYVARWLADVHGRSEAMV